MGVHCMKRLRMLRGLFTATIDDRSNRAHQHAGGAHHRALIGPLGRQAQPGRRDRHDGAGPAANRELGLARMERAGALLSSVEMALFELLGGSDAPSFKQVQALVK